MDLPSGVIYLWRNTSGQKGRSPKGRLKNNSGKADVNQGKSDRLQAQRLLLQPK